VTGSGRPRRIGQCNNAYIFPGVGLGVIASGAQRVTDGMFIAAARALSDLSPALNDRMASLFPSLRNVRQVSFAVARAVAAEAYREGLSTIPPSEIEQLIQNMMWKPNYLKYRRISS
jgi:malate dehydrogenase (oxaloacetate-decarboxylating)